MGPPGPGSTSSWRPFGPPWPWCTILWSTIRSVLFHAGGVITYSRSRISNRFRELCLSSIISNRFKSSNSFRKACGRKRNVFVGFYWFSSAFHFYRFNCLIMSFGNDEIIFGDSFFSDVEQPRPEIQLLPQNWFKFLPIGRHREKFLWWLAFCPGIDPKWCQT